MDTLCFKVEPKRLAHAVASDRVDEGWRGQTGGGGEREPCAFDSFNASRAEVGDNTSTVSSLLKSETTVVLETSSFSRITFKTLRPYDASNAHESGRRGLRKSNLETRRNGLSGMNEEVWLAGRINFVIGGGWERVES